jgi:pyruvate-formate lyase-activating enzyme
MRTEGSFAGRRWLELALDYRCNLRCLGCHACHDRGERLRSSDALAMMKAARAAGVLGLWFGGGEPTLREDLLSLVREARTHGFAEVAVQTNGLRLAYRPYREALLAAGATEIRLNVKSHRPEVHDRLSGGEPCHALLLEALGGLAGGPARVSADVLVTRSTSHDLPETVAFLAKRGVERVALWLLSAADASDPAVLAEVPRIADIVQPLAESRTAARALGVELSTLHTPPCTLPEDLRDIYVPSASLGLVVVDPGARPFALEASPFEGNAYTPGCAQCSARSRCGGPRADYIAIHGASDFAPLRS